MRHTALFGVPATAALVILLLIILQPDSGIMHADTANPVSAIVEQDSVNIFAATVKLPAGDTVLVNSVITDTVTAGIVHHHIRDAGGPWNIHVLRADLNIPGIQVKVVKASDGRGGNLFAREKTSSMVLRFRGQSHVAGAVNADFFNMQNGAPINLHVSDGVPLRRPVMNPGRSVFIIYADGTPDIRVPEMQIRLRLRNGVMPVTGINEARLKDGLVLYNHFFGTSTGSNRYGTEVMLRLIEEDLTVGRITMVADSVFTDRGNARIHDGYYVLSAHGSVSNDINRSVRPGDTLKVTYHYNSERNILQAAGGLPQILCDGEDCVDESAKRENVHEGFITTRHPRTAIGISEERDRIYLVTIDGRRPESTGMTLYEVAAFMKQIGSWNALNLDGGGSTTMVVGADVVNLTSDLTGERAVSNAILILTEEEER